MDQGSGFGGGGSGLDDKLAKWLRGLEPRPETVLFVGHNTSQDYCLNHLAGSPRIPGDNRACVLVHEPSAGGEWSCTASHPGMGARDAA